MKPTLWTKNFIFTCLGASLMQLALQMHNSTLSIFANDAWNSMTLGGYLTTTYNIGSIILAFFGGFLADRYGRKKCLTFAFFGYFVFTLTCALFPVPLVVLPSRIIQGMAKSVVFVAASSIVADVVEKERMGEGLGVYGLGSTLSIAFAPMLGLRIIADYGYIVMFTVSALILLIACLLSMFIDYEKLPAYSKSAEEKRVATYVKTDTGYRGIWKLLDKSAMPASIIYTVFFGSLSCILIFGTVYAKDILNLSSTQIGFFYIVSAAVMFLSRLIIGRVTDRHSALYGLIPGYIASICSIILLAFFASKSYFLFLLSGAFYGLTTSTIMPTTNSIVIVDALKSRAGAANATYFCLMDFGIMFASTISGSVIERAVSPEKGYRTVFTFSVIICFIALILTVIFLNDKAREKRKLKYSSYYV